MAIRPDPAYEAAASPIYGRFLGIFESEHQQVHASLFERNDQLDVYLSYEKHLEPSQITDPYLEELEDFASKRKLHLKIKHVVN